MNDSNVYFIKVSPKIAWSRELVSLQDAGFGAFMAGGCLRDLHNGAEVKDVDFFVNADDRFADYALEMGWQPSVGGDYIGDEIAGIWTYQKGDREYNVILMKAEHTLVSLIDRMDFGICQIGTANGTDVWATPKYLLDRDNKTFTITDPSRHERSLRRWERLRVKYPGWSLVEA